MSPVPDDDLIRADLYVMGLLDPSELAEAERRLLSDEAFAAHVGDAARRLSPLDDSAAPLPLPAGAWARLEARLAASVPEVVPETPPPAPSVQASPARIPGRVAPANLSRAPWRERLAWVAVALLALGLGWPLLRGAGSGTPEGAAAVAVLLDPGGAPFALVEDFGGGKAAVTTLAAYEVPEGESLQVWTKWSEEVGPVSLGVLDEFASTPLGADSLPDPVAGQLYEITLEDEGGSITGRPTGPILGVGRASIPR